MTDFYTRLANYYDLLYAWKDYKSEAKRLHKLIRQYKTSDGTRLLDVACGTGGHIQYLKKKYEITGFDVSETMLAVARAKIQGVEFIQGNMIEMELDQQFDVIICLFGSIGYLTTKQDLTKSIQAFAKHTKPGGVVILEPIFTKETFKPGHLNMRCVNQPEFKLARLNRTRRVRDIVYLDFHFLLTTSKGTEHFFDPSPIGLFSQTDFRTIIESNGFTFKPIEKGLSHQELYIGVKAKHTQR